MRRIYFLSPDIGITHKIVAELQAEGINDQHIHILAKRDTPLKGLHEAGVTIKTDFIPAVERGLALGGSAGFLFGLMALRFSGFVIAGGPLLGIILASATIASLASGLIGMGLANTRLTKFASAIEAGELLVLVDIPKERIETITQLIVTHHPEVEFEGLEPILPPSY